MLEGRVSCENACHVGLSDKSTLYFALKGQFSGFLQEVNISSGLIQIQESLFFLSLLLVVMRSDDLFNMGKQAKYKRIFCACLLLANS